MTAKRYRLFMNRRKYDYTYNQQTGVVRMRLPGTSEFITTQSPTADAARADVRGLLEIATGQKARRSPERVQFLRDILCTLAEQGLRSRHKWRFQSYGCGDYVDRTLTAPINDGGEYTSVTVWYPDEDDNGQAMHVITEDSITSALGKVNDALTEEQRKALGISEGWRKRVSQANRANDGGMINPYDAARLAEIAVFGKVIYGRWPYPDVRE